ncbi:23899_t:CDS:1, partial [Cetraspora pellucida]
IRGRPEELKSHLALFCNVIPQDIKLEYLEILANINSSKKTKNNSSSSEKLVFDYYDSTTNIEPNKKNRIDQALIRFFICCGIPFSVVGHPYFIDFIKSLCYGYIPPNRLTLSTTILNQEISTVLIKINKELEYENNLTL